MFDDVFIDLFYLYEFIVNGVVLVFDFFVDDLFERDRDGEREIVARLYVVFIDGWCMNVSEFLECVEYL